MVTMIAEVIVNAVLPAAKASPWPHLRRKSEKKQRVLVGQLRDEDRDEYRRKLGKEKP